MQSAKDITFHPSIDLSAVGLTPAGLPLFRVVKADTRLESSITSDGVLVSGPVYPNLGDKWVLERWLPAEEFAGSPLQYAAMNRQFGRTMPYPYSGEYDAVRAFEFAEELQLAHQYARMSRHGKETLSLADRMKIRRVWHEEERRRVSTERREIIAEAAPSRFGRVAEQVQLYGSDGRPVQI